MAQKKSYLDKKYILREGTLLYYNSTHFSNDTLTDKIAESAIKKFPKLDGLFITEKERKVLEALDTGVKHVEEAEADLHNDPILKEIIELVKGEQYEDAREKAVTLDGDKVKENSLKSIDQAEEKAIEAVIKKEEADKKAAAKKIEDKKVADKKAADKKKEEADKANKDSGEK